MASSIADLMEDPAYLKSLNIFMGGWFSPPPGYVGEWPMPRVQLEAPYSPARYDDPTEDPGYERSVRIFMGQNVSPDYPFPYVHRRLPTPPPRRRGRSLPLPEVISPESSPERRSVEGRKPHCGRKVTTTVGDHNLSF
ncbi:hypothetical protein CDAR_464051 [Caerostris darwini]|uniref:Uncharacterized protein n=1 Tax=Caerostris darwini TaxID=1538125 RepID=A0AAV4VVR6_9ARAC|nr:hypothetical protein CDAR_464051 [Caerostris darwini]